jgi:hypothetical protein
MKMKWSGGVVGLSRRGDRSPDVQSKGIRCRDSRAAMFAGAVKIKLRFLLFHLRRSHLMAQSLVKVLVFEALALEALFPIK